MTPDVLAETHARAISVPAPWCAEDFASILARPGAILTGDAHCFVLGRVTLDEAEILTLATDPAHRRRGLARAALAGFHEAAHRDGARRVFLEVAADNTAALALYRSADYAPIGRRRAYYPGPVDALVLSRALPDAKPPQWP